MDNSESTNPDIAKVEVERQMDAQVARVTEIVINGRTDIESLRRLLENYQQSNRPNDTNQPDDAVQESMNQEDLLVSRANRRESVLRETILDVVLSLEENPNRDLSSQPILLPEVAELVQVMTGIDVLRSRQLPFLLNENTDLYEPDLETLFVEAVTDKKGTATFDDIAFAFAYTKVRADVARATLDTSSVRHIPEGLDSSGSDA